MLEIEPVRISDDSAFLRMRDEFDARYGNFTERMLRGLMIPASLIGKARDGNYSSSAIHLKLFLDRLGLSGPLKLGECSCTDLILRPKATA